MTSLQRFLELFGVDNLADGEVYAEVMIEEDDDDLPGASGQLSLKGQVSIALAAIGVVAVWVEFMFRDARDALLGAVGLEGLGIFLWFFLGLAVTLGLIWRHIAELVGVALRAAEELVRYARTGQVDPHLRQVCDLEAFRAGLPLPSSVGHPQVRMEYLTQLLEAHIERLFKYVDSFRDIGILMAGQIGLLGTFIGLSRCFRHMVTTVKHLANAGSGAFAALAGSGLETVFSTTEAGVYVIIVVAGCSVMLWLRVHQVSRQFNLFLRAANARIVKQEITVKYDPEASVVQLTEDDYEEVDEEDGDDQSTSA